MPEILGITNQVALCPTVDSRALNTNETNQEELLRLNKVPVGEDDTNAKNRWICSDGRAGKELLKPIDQKDWFHSGSDY